jgi:hypothetical protein
MYLIIGIIIWVCLPNDFKEELGCLIGMTIMLCYSVLYLVLFAITPNWDWVDIFGSLVNFSSGINLKW